MNCELCIMNYLTFPSFYYIVYAYCGADDKHYVEAPAVGVVKAAVPVP